MSEENPLQFLPKWVQKNGKNWPKPIKEPFLCGIALFIAITCCILAIHHQLSPGLFLILLFILFFCAGFAQINYATPSPWLHFNRNFEGLLFSATPLMALFYFITWIWDGMTPMAQYRAELMVVYGYFLFIWVVFADVPILGIYFAVRVFSFWSLQFIWQYGPMNLPFVFYVSGILYSLMGLGMWFTSTASLVRVLIRKDSYGEQTDHYFRVAKIIFPVKFVLGLALIFMEQFIAGEILTLVPFKVII
jgi:hypothetical protein